MKKLAMIAVSIGVILVIVGLVMVGIFGGEAIKNINWKNIFNGTGVHDLSKADKVFETNTENLKNITIKSDVYAIYVLPAEDDILSVRYVEPAEDEFKIDVAYDEQSSTLSVTEQGASNVHVGWFWSDWLNGNNFIAVYLPQTETVAQSELDVTVNTASVKIEGITIRSVKCETDTGSVNVSDCSIEDMNLETKTGSATVGKLRCNALTVTTKTGSVNVTETTAEQFAKFEVRTGSVNCDISTNNLDVSGSTGSVNFKTNASVIKIETKTGSVNGTVLGAEKEYQISVHKDTGKSNISNQTVANATKFLTVKVNTGSITINFGNN